MNLSKEEKDSLKWRFNITWSKSLVLSNTFMLIKSSTESNFLSYFSLKLGNLFLNENMEIKLGDFGLATRLEYN